MADPYVGAARTVLGQGLAMGWGDEAEAFLRSKLGQGTYEQQLSQIRGELGQYHKENPVLAPVGEFVGGMLPGLASMAIPGGQVAGAAQLARAASPMANGLLRSGALGALTGAVSGAGSADQDRASGAIAGTVLGGAVGVAAPLAMRGAGASKQWLMERLHPTEAGAKTGAARSLTSQLAKSNVTPADLSKQMAADEAADVPSMLLNATPRLEKSARTVVKRAGAGADDIEKALMEQRLGSRERVNQQVVKRLNPGDYYADLQQLSKDLKTKSDPYYKAAYAKGEVADPEVLRFMNLPQFQQGLKEAEKLLAAEGRQIDLSKPTVEVLDQVKRGIDAMIERETDSVTGKVSSLGRVFVLKKNEFLNALDNAVPEYGQARAVYRGDAELADAMRKGMNDFNKMDHEQVAKLVGGMSDAEKEAFRTGVSRGLYSKIMDPGNNINAAQRLIGSPETQQKLRPLFGSAAEFDLFKNALTRESQLYHTAGRVIGGSDTAENQQLIKAFEGEDGVGPFIERAVTGGFRSSLANSALRAMGKTQMGDMKASKLAEMLMSKDPHEVAAVVRLLEEQAAADAPKAFRATGLERGVVTGLNAMAPTAPIVPRGAPEGTSIDDAAAAQSKQNYDIEDALK